MAVKYKHSDVYSMYFCTFTCYEWMHLFEMTNSYDLVYSWFNILKKDKIEIIGYVIMPNHVHCILYFPEAGFNLNKILSNGKRFMAYEIINRLEYANDSKTLKILPEVITAIHLLSEYRHLVLLEGVRVMIRLLFLLAAALRMQMLVWGRIPLICAN